MQDCFLLNLTEWRSYQGKKVLFFKKKFEIFLSSVAHLLPSFLLNSSVFWWDKDCFLSRIFFLIKSSLFSCSSIASALISLRSVLSEFTIQFEHSVIMEIQIFLIFSDIRLSCHPQAAKVEELKSYHEMQKPFIHLNSLSYMFQRQVRPNVVYNQGK